MHYWGISCSPRNATIGQWMGNSRDPTLWEYPTEFIPKHFLNDGKEMDVKGHNFKLIMFGSGRRICPSMYLALIVVSHTLGRLLQSFEWFAPQGAEIDERRAWALNAQISSIGGHNKTSPSPPSLLI